jgi:hypothetical protein|tara:strand:+ start:313 stop:543 length:231 start_codon:yes stop_codon:yes gene_type:complete
MKKFIPFSILFLCAFLIQANPVDASSNVFSKLLLDETVVSAEMMNISGVFINKEMPRRNRKEKRAQRKLSRRKAEK